jgi:photosystem II stability/assembly factor-like uncharacterized protein
MILYMIDFTSPATGIIVGQGGRILKTTDGGNTWVIKNSGINADLFTLHFIDPNNGWAAGDYGKIIMTADGGETWTNIPTPNTAIIGTIWFTNTNKGWAGQMDGNLLYTIDGGNNWISDLSLGSDAMWTTFFTSQDTGFIAGSNGKMYKTTNGTTVTIDESNQTLQSKINISILPNPIHTDAEINYFLPSKSLCSLNILDVKGNQIASLINEVKENGKHQLRFNSKEFANGIYYCELKTNNQQVIKKVIISH